MYIIPKKMSYRLWEMEQWLQQDSNDISRLEQEIRQLQEGDYPMRMTTIKIKDRTGNLDHRCMETHHYVTILEPVSDGMTVQFLKYRAGFLTCGDFEMACYTTDVELVCGTLGMAKAIEALPVTIADTLTAEISPRRHEDLMSLKGDSK
jgi:hypothetical protein